MLQKLGLVVDVYYASEIDPDALMVSASHFGDRIVHLGDIRDITKEKIKEIGPIDLLIGGSPCNDLSLANPARLGLHGSTINSDTCALRGCPFQHDSRNSFFRPKGYRGPLLRVLSNHEAGEES